MIGISRKSVRRIVSTFQNIEKQRSKLFKFKIKVMIFNYQIC